MPELTGWAQVTPWGLIILMVATFFGFLARGKLYTKSQHDELMLSQRSITDIYKTAAEKAEAGYAEQVRQNGLLVDQLSTFGHFIEEADRVRGTTPSTGDTGTQEGGFHVRS